MPQLDPSSFPSQLFWLVASFIILYVVMSRIALPKIAGALQNRQEKIGDDIDRAKKLKEEAAKLEKEYKKLTEDNKAKSNALIFSAQEEARKYSDAKHADVAKDIAKKSVDAEKKIADARAKALGEIESVAAGLTKSLVEKVGLSGVDSAKIESAVKKVRGGNA